MKKNIPIAIMALLVVGFLISSIGDAPLGTISYVNGNPIPGVAINYSGAANGSTGTNNNGNYVIVESLSNGDVLNISPQAGSLACELDCINVHDLYLISEYIQGNNTLDPYGILAADANASESITSLDLTAITFLLLGFNSEYSENNCEGFVPADYTFVDVTNPFVTPIPQSVDYTHGVSPGSTLNFNYYQVGDVNQCNDDPVADDLTFRITDNLTLNPNDQVTIPITVENFSNITGFQFTVEWDPAVVTYLGQGGFGSLAGYTTFDLGQSESSSGFLRTVWLSELGPQSNPDGSLLFAMQFEAIGSPGSSTPISINGSKITVLGLDDVVQPILPNTEDGSVTIAGEVPICEFGLNTNLLADTTHACCWTLDFFNESPEDIYAIELSTQDGVTLDYTLSNGFYAPNYSSTSVLISPDPLGVIPATANGIVEICLNNAYVSPQLVTVDYWNSAYEISCSETLIFDCPIEAMCLAVLSDTLSCDSVGYNYSLDVSVPPGADYDLGLIKLNVTAPAVLAGEYPLTFTPALQPGDQVTLDFALPTSSLFSANDSLCYILTAHNGPGEELCCFALDTCIAFPVCDPCPDIAAIVSDLSDDCCYQLALTNDYTDAPGYFSQVQTTILTPGVSFSDINYNLTSGWQQASSTSNDILWNFNGGVPNGTFNFFDFCMDGVTTTDSVCVAVNWLNNENVVCRDTVKVFCPDCLLFTEEEITCNPATGVYSYTFSGQNRSNQDANTISLLEDDPTFSISPASISLGSTVSPSGSFGPLSFNITPTGAQPGDTICIDFVLRNVISNDINIECCYITHCFVLPECEGEQGCPDIVCVPPPDVVFPCENLPANFDPFDINFLEDFFGVAAVSGCPAFNIVESTPLVNLNDCNRGTITRSFTVDDGFGNSSSCQQIITIEDTGGYSLAFPADITTTCTTVANDVPPISLGNTLCDDLAVSIFSDTYVEPSNDICLIVQREYRVINWCEYDGQAPPVVISRDEDCNGIPGDETVTVAVEGGVTYTDNNSVATDNIPAANTRGTSCDGLSNPAGYWRSSLTTPGLSSVGYWSYTQWLIIPSVPFFYSVTAEEQYCVDSDDCLAEVQVLVDLLDECELGVTTVITYDEDADGNGEAVVQIDPDGTVVDLTNPGIITVSGTMPNWVITLTDIPIGDHALLVQGQNSCGGGGANTIPISVVDCDQPFFICQQGLTYNLIGLDFPFDVDGDGDVDFAAINAAATDFIDGEFFDCGEPLVYAIARPGDGVPPMNQLTISLVCDDVGLLDLVIYGWDVNGNFSTCEVQINVQVEPGPCGGLRPEATLQLYPNPVTNSLQVSVDNGIPVGASLYNREGQLCQQQSFLQNNNNVLDISQLSPGVYLLQVQLADGSLQMQRVVKM